MKLEMEPLIKQLKAVRIGQSFRVNSESARQAVLRAAKVLGLLIHTRPSKRGGFTVTRLPE